MNFGDSNSVCAWIKTGLRQQNKVIQKMFSRKKILSFGHSQYSWLAMAISNTVHSEADSLRISLLTIYVSCAQVTLPQN